MADSPVLARAYALATEAHGVSRRATDRGLFIDHVVEVATLLRDAGFDEDVVAAGLLHDAVERGTATEEGVRAYMGDRITQLVLALTEDESLDAFAERKDALREQVRSAGPRAIAVFAADKLSDIGGLRRGSAGSRDALEERMGTTVAEMARHYAESVEMIAANDPHSDFLPLLREALRSLETPFCKGSPATQ